MLRYIGRRCHSLSVKRALRTVCAVALALVLAAFSMPLSVLADTGAQPDLTRALSEDDFRSELDSLSNKLKDLQEQQDQLKDQIAGAKSDKEKKLAEKTQWEKQIQNSKDEIAVLEERIAMLEGRIEEKLLEIDETQADIDHNFDQYKKRLRATYMMGESSTLSMVLGASDFTDLLMRTEFVRSTAERDKNLLETLRVDRKKLEQARLELEEAKKGVEEDNARCAEKKKELEAELVKTNSQIQDISMLEQEYAQRNAELNKMDAAVQAQIDEIFAQIDSSTEYIGGTFGWPLPKFSKISSYYGWRFSNTNFHTGIDVTGSSVYGASIRASNSGKVVYVQNSYTPGVGYGRHVIVDHGGGYTTLYAHMSSITVKEGDFVTRSVSEIGKVGSTGWSTGPHLHFEVRVSGKHQNPLEYLKG